MFYDILVRSHSGLRWVVILLLLLVIIRAIPRVSARVSPDAKDRMWSIFAMASVHLQIVIGLILYAISPKVQFSANTMSNDVLRFFTVEHILGMVIAAMLVTVAHRKSKGPSLKSMFWYYFITLVVILISIPWPFRGLGNGWF